MMSTIENMFDIKIDYYIKVDLKSLSNLIDKIGGIEVESDNDFILFGFEFEKGNNHLDGEASLVFLEYSSNLYGGSRVKCSNQIKLLRALLGKILANNSYLDYLDELKETIKTNIPTDKILRFIKNQITYDHNWDIRDYMLDGADKYAYTYSSKCCKIAVIEPNMSTVNNAITLIEYLKTDSIFN